MLQHSDKYLARQSLHHELVLSIGVDVVYTFYLLKESGYRRYTSFELRQDIDAKQQDIVLRDKSVSSQQTNTSRTN